MMAIVVDFVLNASAMGDVECVQCIVLLMAILKNLQ